MLVPTSSVRPVHIPTYAADATARFYVNFLRFFLLGSSISNKFHTSLKAFKV